MIGGNQITEWGTPTKKNNSVSLYPPHFAVTRLSRKNNHASTPSANPCKTSTSNCTKNQRGSSTRQNM